MKRTNQRMEQMLQSLAPLLERRDMVGYAAARNARRLRDELREYELMRDGLVERYGEPEKSEGGEPTGRTVLHVTSPNFPAFAEEMGKFAAIEHDFEPFLIPYSEAIGKLSGEELLEADWMFEDRG